MSVPEITEFDFQTEDYRDQMEVEMQWINDNERLEEDVPSFLESQDVREYDKPEMPEKNDVQTDHLTNEQSGDSGAEALQILPLMPANREDNNEDNTQTLTEEPLQLSNNRETSDSKTIKRINHFSPSRRSLSAKNQRKRRRGVTRKERPKKSKAKKVNEEGQWQTVIGSDGKQILQRVLTLPTQTIELSKGYKAVGKKEIITEQEEVVTERLKPIVREEVIEMPTRRIT